jgi:hypothetical protein
MSPLHLDVVEIDLERFLYSQCKAFHLPGFLERRRNT